MRLLIDVFALLLGFLVAYLLVAQHDRSARDACFSAAGRVEHYDGDRPDVWRCVGTRTEGE